MRLGFFSSMTRALFTTVILLALSVPTLSAQNDGEYYASPEAVRVGRLPRAVGGTSSLFYLGDTLWTCNDHGALKLFALDTLTAAVLETLDLGVTVRDLEEVAQDSLYLYFGDFGNNRGNRTDLRILRLARNRLRDGQRSFDTIHFDYPDFSRTLARNFDCEAFVAGADSLYLFTKQWLSQGSVCYALPKQPGTYTARRRFTLHTDGLVTGACYLPAQRTLALVGYSLAIKPFVYLVDGFDNEDFSSGRHRRVTLANPVATQAEGIATLDAVHFFLTNEKLTVRFLTHRAALLRLDLSGMPEESNVR